jgi:hypothetical protein
MSLYAIYTYIYIYYNLQFKKNILLTIHPYFIYRKTEFDSKYPINQSKNVKRFLPEDVKDYEQSKHLVLNQEDFHVSSTSKSSRNIIKNSNCVSSQINKYKRTYSQNEVSTFF